MNSLWPDWPREEHPPLRGFHLTEVAIVGGGLTGLFCAVILARAGLKVMVLEARRMGQGATMVCTGGLSPVFSSAYQTSTASVNPPAALAHWELLSGAFRDLPAFLKECGIAADFTPMDAVCYAYSPRTAERLDALAKRLQEAKIPVERSSSACLFPVDEALLVRQQGRIRTPALVEGLMRAARESGCILCENSPVRDISGTTLRTDTGQIGFSAAILATGVPITLRDRRVLSLLRPVGKISVRMSPMHGDTLMVPVSPGGLMVTPYPDAWMTGWQMGPPGRDHTPEMARFERILHARLPEHTREGSILRQDVHTADGLPLIGPLSHRDSHLLMASGYNGSGILHAFSAARMLKRYLLDKPLPEDAFFHPLWRRAAPSPENLLLRAGRRMLPAGSAPRCPHMGCRLKWDDAAGRWECPCHGSSFTRQGEVITGPATQDIRRI